MIRHDPASHPFDPPPASVLDGALGWRYVKRRNHDGSRWHPVAWEIVRAESILIVDYATRTATRESSLYAP